MLIPPQLNDNIKPVHLLHPGWLIHAQGLAFMNVSETSSCEIVRREDLITLTEVQ